MAPGRAGGAARGGARGGAGAAGGTRRGAVGAGLGLLAGAALGRARARAAPAAAAAAVAVPKGYSEAAGKLAEGLQGALELEREGASEGELRRAGEQTKPLIRDFLGKFGVDAQAVPESYRDLAGVLGDLGAFYRDNGPRASLPADKLEGLLGQLDAARAQLAREDQEAAR